MESQNWLFFAVVSLLSFFSQRACAGSYNITETLDKYSDYTQFNQLLSRTGIASAINARGTVTVLVVNDGAAGSLSGQSDETIKTILRLHVILDFLNTDKIKNLKRTATYTNMYQTTGAANQYQGLTNVTKTSSDNNNNQVMFGNGKQNATLTVSMQKVVSAVAPLSVIEVSGLIQPDWVFNIKASPPKKAPSPGPSDAPAPSRRHRKEAPQSAESPEADSPPEPDADAESSDSPAPAPGASHSAAASPSATAAAFAMLVGLLAFTMGF